MTNKKTDLLKRVLKLYVAAVSDAADELELSPVCMDREIRPVTKNTRMAGFARTGKLVRAPVQRPYDEEQLHDFMSLATQAKKGDLVVITSSGANDCSVWGQVLTRIGKPKGLQGAVVDGTSRDIHDIDRMNFPVFARGRHPATMRGRLDMESVGEPIVCGGVVVKPGDLIFADGDGVVAVPRDHAEDVISAAEEVVGTDTWWVGKLEEGEDPHDLHEEKPIP